MHYDIREIAGVVEGKLVRHDSGKSSVVYLLTDSRKLQDPASSLFFALSGNNNDGHAFIGDLYAKGVACFVVSKWLPSFDSMDASFIVVGNVLAALQKLSAFHRRRFSYPVVAITGSNGKTVVKEWMFQLLRHEKNIVRSPKSYNSQIGVPLSVWLMEADNDLAIFEAGISKPGEMECLQNIIRPDIGIFTNIGQAHDENFSHNGTYEEKVKEKMLLFRNVSLLIYCKDYASVHHAVSDPSLFPSTVKSFTWSKKQKADMQIARIQRMERETEIQCIYRQDFLSIRIPFTDDASIENAIHCWAYMLCTGYPQETIASRMEYLSPVAMRLEMKAGINNCSIINDSYNSDLGSLGIALDFLTHQNPNKKRTIILSDILQSGRDETELYANVAAMLQHKHMARLIGIGPAISRQMQAFKMDKMFFQSTEEFLRSNDALSFRDEIILLKGARPFGFERISKMLQQKAHETVLEINLNALVHNLNYYRSRLGPGKKIMAMVKAFSYGSGSSEIAHLMQFHRADYLAVAYADEGAELRRAGINLPIMVMNPDAQSFETIINCRLEPEIYSFRILNEFSDALARNFSQGIIQDFPVHIKLDTGMHRLGFTESEINEMVVRIRNNKMMRIHSVFSHLAASDDPAHDEFTTRQIDLFRRMGDRIVSHFNHPILRHILNTSGISRFPEAQFDMVRLGIGLYGVASFAEEQKNLMAVGTLKSSISQIKNISAGDTIGYGRRGIAEKETVIATIAIGYADGFSRRLGNGNGKIWVNGKAAPVVGSVCMDMCMVDITGIQASEGDEVIVFSPEHPIHIMAADAGTIPYEILTSVSQRVKRVYFQE
jgi:alanine racemase